MQRSVFDIVSQCTWHIIIISLLVNRQTVSDIPIKTKVLEMSEIGLKGILKKRVQHVKD